MGYVTVAEMRAEGVAATYVDATVQAAIDLASQYMDRACRQWFESRSYTAYLDGQDSDRLFLPVPIITLTELYINNRFTAQDKLLTADYVVYNGKGFPDDRRNPKVELINSRRSIFQVPALQQGGRIFMKGKRNQKLVGTFGFTEEDGTTPLLIVRAVKKMCLRFLDVLSPTGGGSGTTTSSGVIIGESTDGHFIQYATPGSAGVKAASMGISRDPEVEQIIQMYRAPITLAVPGSSNWELG